METYCLSAIDSLLQEYISSAIYPFHTDWYAMILQDFLLSLAGIDYDVTVDAGRWARGDRKIPVHIRRYYVTQKGQMALAQTIRQRYIPYAIDIGHLAMRIDHMIRSDATLHLAIREHMGHLYPCNGDDAYAMYIA